MSGGRIIRDPSSRTGLRQLPPRFPVRCGPVVGSAGGDASGCRDVVLDSGCVDRLQDPVGRRGLACGGSGFL